MSMGSVCLRNSKEVDRVDRQGEKESGYGKRPRR